jgi:ribosomal protein L32E
MPRAPYIHEKYTREVNAARKAAREYFDRFPKDRYDTVVESWRHLQCDNYEFTMKRLREPKAP